MSEYVTGIHYKIFSMGMNPRRIWMKILNYLCDKMRKEKPDVREKNIGC